MFKTRIGVLCVLLGLGFVTVLCRLWQLQVTRYEKYQAIASQSRKPEQMVAALRAPILDRNGEPFADEMPVHDLSVRVYRLKFDYVSIPEICALAQKFRPPVTREPGFEKKAEILNDERDAEFKRLTLRLPDEPFVKDLARTIKRSEEDVCSGVLKALERVARGWASSHAALTIVTEVDEKVWLGLSVLHQDVFMDSSLQGTPARTVSSEAEGQAQEPPFPGLVCTVSVRRTYPHKSLACFVIGAVGELSPAEEDDLRQDGILFDNAAARERYWSRLRETLDDENASRLEVIMHGDPRELVSVGELYSALSRLSPSERQMAGNLGLAEPLRWMARPPRMQLLEPELLWMGVGMPPSPNKNSLPNKIIGEQGVERIQNDKLRPKQGMKLRMDDKGDDDDMKFTSDSRPKDGTAIALSISMKWQAAVEKALKAQEYLGAVVVLDCKSGEVLAMASNPDFDPNLFAPPRTGFERQEKLRNLLDDPRKPLLNRAISEQYPLGSVMKSLIAAVALERGLVSTTETFECPGYIIEGGQKFHCDDSRAHGTVNLMKALRCSCNVTFHQIGARIGVENLGPYAKLILGKRTGIDLPAEAAGIYPDRAWRLKAYPDNPSARIWTRGNDFLLAIGQGQMTCTVLQAAVMMSAICNGGNVVTPRVWLDGPVVPSRPLGVSPGNLAIVRQGLEEVVNVGRAGERGTAYAPFHDHGPEVAVRVAGKTSTAEHGHNAKPHAWFVGYAPADHPEVAFAVLLEEAGHGGTAAAPVAYQFLKEIYGTK